MSNAQTSPPDRVSRTGGHYLAEPSQLMLRHGPGVGSTSDAAGKAASKVCVTAEMKKNEGGGKRLGWK